MSAAPFSDDVEEFTKLYCEKTGKPRLNRLDRAFIVSMIQDEVDELLLAKDEAEEVDALLDICYYCLQHMRMANLDPAPFWQLVHQANMTKFGPGGYRRESDGKWMKPPNFQPPDNDIRLELAHQRATTTTKLAQQSGSSMA